MVNDLIWKPGELRLGWRFHRLWCDTVGNQWLMFCLKREAANDNPE